MNTIWQRIRKIRGKIKFLRLDGAYFSCTDPHFGEYLPDRWQTRAYISGFTGSYGVVVVTKSEALLWTDTRYFIQAEEQLKGTGIQLQKLRVPDAVAPERWLLENLQEGSRIGVDPDTVSASTFNVFYNLLKEKEIELVEVPDFFETIWEDRPGLPMDKLFELPTKYSGFSRAEKKQQIVEKLKKEGADATVITLLDEVAWTFNLRGNDVHYNPVFTAYGWLEKNKTVLFVKPEKVPDKLAQTLASEGIEVQDYEALLPFLDTVKNKRIFLDKNTTSQAVYKVLSGNNHIVGGISVIGRLKALKNKVEIEGFRKAMEKDGVALVEFLAWLDKNIRKKELTEYDIGRKLKKLRARQKNFVEESFPPIVGYKAHGPIVHLVVGPHNALPLKNEGILLFDSGGQYIEGTTDITRTIALGPVTLQQQKDFTLVLKGLIALTTAHFPAGTKGCNLDVLARKALWSNGLDYGHGTGHGVGHFLNVHEGPMSIRQEYNEISIEPGMVMSNEPGIYRKNEYGVRIENMIVCVETGSTEFGNFYGFETLTLCPIDKKLIVTDMLTMEEREWINNYHKRVKTILKPLLAKKLHAFLNVLTETI
ncbi:MAG: peptidase M24 [Draconibacterium sp.]|nr:MAG: peptidase M24 [Draconibacterium sp.]PIF05551.1 MAG: peptidase M24 [Draconibacterium sp.]